jgi:SpoVK/Ycf46/Vps4 family AAA+-type ATPase
MLTSLGWRGIQRVVQWSMNPDEKPTPGDTRASGPSASWDDLALAEESLHQLHDLAERVVESRRDLGEVANRQSRRGVVAIFTGEPVSAKLVAAQVLAGRLGAELLTVDVAAVISKYIGETEKNLGRVFAAAQESGAVLFFDEADSLFGHRTDVEDAHGRYQNQETAYLLQRIEAFTGLVILATNTPQEPGLAVIRRTAVEVRFPAP